MTAAKLVPAQLLEQPLKTEELDVVKKLQRWLEEHKYASWTKKKLKESPGVELEQCLDKSLHDLVKPPLVPEGSECAIFRTRTRISWNFPWAGFLIPILVGEGGCIVMAGSTTCDVRCGSKLILPSEVALKVAEENMVYLLWYE